MKYLSKVKVCLLLIAVAMVSPATANLLSDPDFSSGSLNAVDNTWSLTQDSLNQWYSYSSGGIDFYNITDGYATAATPDQSDRLLLQVIQAPDAGDYNFSFDYRLSDDSDMYSVTRVFQVQDSDNDFTINTTDWAGTFTEVNSADRIYDQGGYASCLSTALDWTSVSSQISVSDSADYLVIYAAFSHDGTDQSLLNEHADLDNFAITNLPEPATIALLLIGGIMLRTKKNF